jgi:NAD(P)-dependent dehydrogenase (short-subunit alcohol dehydrogenase family)
MERRLAGKTAIITGGARGIGKGIALRFLAEGGRVMIADIDAEAGKETEAALQESERFSFIHADAASEPSVENAVAKTLERFGRLDILINNAGIAAARNRPVAELPLEAWNRMIGTNLTGYFLFVKHAVPHLRASNGKIVNIASTRALQSEPDTEAYAAAKGGVVALTHALAVSLGPEIRVNCISPGWIDTAGASLRPIDHLQHPAGRVGLPEDIAAMALFLVSDASGFVTGQSFVIDGGMTRKMIYAPE